MGGRMAPYGGADAIRPYGDVDGMPSTRTAMGMGCRGVQAKGGIWGADAIRPDGDGGRMPSARTATWIG
jgi:hypothetical protein